jgi:polysaccharide chain length determinant protein (PEP-CTERM system associated)
MAEGRNHQSLNFEDYAQILRRRRWWILFPVFLCWVIGWSISWLIPSTYKSEALILVEQQKVPEQYVVPNVSVNLQDRLQSMTQQILSRTRLQATIDRYHLYPIRQGAGGFARSEDAVEEMRKDIKIELVKSPGRGELTSFKIQYASRSPLVAQRVNGALTSLFIDENLKSQQQLSESTTAFLANQLEAARSKLEEQEAKVRAFKASHFGNLPSQLESNVQILTGLQTQLQNSQRSLDTAKQQKIYLESLLHQHRSGHSRLGDGDSEVASPSGLENKLLDLRRSLEQARVRHTDDYPDVVALKDDIAKTEKLKRQIDAEIASRPKSNPGTTVELGEADGGQGDSISPMMQIQSQLKANELEIQNYQRRENTIQAQISSYQARLNLTPATEQELADISRGYEESKTNYNSLLQKQNQSQLATSLEQRQQGEQFSILDPPSLPERPSAPNHLGISVASLMLGFAVGLILTVFREMTNVCVRQEKDLDGIVPINMLVGIPHLDTPGEDRSRVWFRRMELGAGVVIAILILAGNLYAFYKS